MDSRDVSTLIRRHARPVLAQQGFETFTTRTAWRRWEEGVDVVNFQSVGADYAAVVGCTPFSFVVNLGIYLHYVPHGEVRQRDGGPAPEEHECTLRGHVVPPGPRATPDVGSHDVWYLRADGSDAEAAVREAAALLDERAPRWFERFRD